MKLEGVKSNRSAIGARVLVHAAAIGRRRRRSSASRASIPRTIHGSTSGSAAAAIADVEIFWPNGRHDDIQGRRGQPARHRHGRRRASSRTRAGPRSSDVDMARSLRRVRCQLGTVNVHGAGHRTERGRPSVPTPHRPPGRMLSPSSTGGHMRTRRLFCERVARGVLVLLTCGVGLRAVHRRTSQGVVEDPSGGGHRQRQPRSGQPRHAGLRDHDLGCGSGNYRFLSLAPGPYKVTAEAQGFRKPKPTVTLQTNQTLNVPISLEVGALTETRDRQRARPRSSTRGDPQPADAGDRVAVRPAAAGPQLHLARDAWRPACPGSARWAAASRAAPARPGSGVDNYSTETAVDVSANGQGTVANKFIIDGLNVTSGIRQGVLNLTPNPDAIQETSIQVNTFSVRVRRRQLDPDDQHDEVGIGAVPRAGQRLLQQREHVREHRVHGAGREIQSVPLATTSRSPSAARSFRRSSSSSSSRSSRCAPRRRRGTRRSSSPTQQFATWARQNYPEHVRHAHPEHVRAERGRPSAACRKTASRHVSRRPAAQPPRTTCPARRR